MLMEGAALLSQLYADEHMGSGSLYTLSYSHHILISDVLFIAVSALSLDSTKITARADSHAVTHAVQFNQNV